MSIKSITPITTHPVTGKTIVWCSYKGDGFDGYFSLVDDLETTDRIKVKAISLLELMVSPDLQAKIRVWVWQNVCTQSAEELVTHCKKALPHYLQDIQYKNIDNDSKQFYTETINLIKLMITTNGTHKITF